LAISFELPFWANQAQDQNSGTKAMRRYTYVWLTACLALSAMLGIHLRGNDVSRMSNTVLPVTQDSGPSVPVERSDSNVTRNPFQQKLQEQQGHDTNVKPQVIVTPKIGQDPFKAFLEKQSELTHQSPFSD
jgi:hypothetical protein